MHLSKTDKIVGTATPCADDLEHYRLSWHLSTGDSLVISRPLEVETDWEHYLEFRLMGSYTNLVCLFSLKPFLLFVNYFSDSWVLSHDSWKTIHKWFNMQYYSQSIIEGNGMNSGTFDKRQEAPIRGSKRNAPGRRGLRHAYPLQRPSATRQSHRIVQLASVGHGDSPRGRRGPCAAIVHGHDEISGRLRRQTPR